MRGFEKVGGAAFVGCLDFTSAHNVVSPHAAPFTLSSESITEQWNVASRYDGDKRTAGQILRDEKRGDIWSVFPAEWAEKPYEEIKRAAKKGIRSAQTAKKLLDSREYDRSEL